jgi:hypothetical protein
MKAAEFGMHCKSAAAFVATNSICQGQQVSFLWTLIFDTGQKIAFAHASFKWSNLASHNAGVTVVIVGISREPVNPRRLFSVTDDGESISKEVSHINPYLVSGADVIVNKAMSPLTEVGVMDFGNKADDGGHLTLSSSELESMGLDSDQRTQFIKRFFGSKEFINGETRYCVWVTDDDLPAALQVGAIVDRIEMVRATRLKSKDAYARGLASRSHQFKTPRLATKDVIIRLGSAQRTAPICRLAISPMTRSSATETSPSTTRPSGTWRSSPHAFTGSGSAQSACECEPTSPTQTPSAGTPSPSPPSPTKTSAT